MDWNGGMDYGLEYGLSPTQLIVALAPYSTERVSVCIAGLTSMHPSYVVITKLVACLDGKIEPLWIHVVNYE